MAIRTIGRGLLLVACLAAAVYVLNRALWSAQGSSPTVAGIQRELALNVGTKLLVQGVYDPVSVICAPPPGYTLQPPLHLVCQIVAHDLKRPKKSPVWVEDVTCGLPVPAGTPNCGSSGGDALQ
jgi:hypothetical protein